LFARLPLLSARFHFRVKKRGRPPNRFQQLRWKLTLNYTAVTVAALITVELLLLGLLAVTLYVLLNSGVLQAQLIEAASTTYSPTLRHFLMQTSPDLEGVNLWLEGVGKATSGTLPLSIEPTGEMLLVSRDGTLLGTRPSDLLGSEAVGRPVNTQTIPGMAEPLYAALEGAEDAEELFSAPLADENVVMAVPIWNAAHERVLGALILMEEAPTVLGLLADILPILAVSLLVFTLIAGLTGTAYGFLAAHGPVRRIDRLSKATLAWSRGDFSTYVEDPSGDELGQLAERLNNMAHELAQLVETRRALAVMEERSRLARELHDSAKQQAFAAAAQISGISKLMERDPATAAAHIEEAERLMYELRQELTGLILELRPAALEGDGLAQAVRDYVADWSRQNGVEPELHIRDERALPVDVELALFRIMQEALANVARHSRADSVSIQLTYNTNSIILVVRDDGRGFRLNDRSSGFGMRSMQQRAATLGGDLSIKSAPGEGTSVSCTAPLSGPVENDEAKT